MFSRSAMRSAAAAANENKLWKHLGIRKQRRIVDIQNLDLVMLSGAMGSSAFTAGWMRQAMAADIRTQIHRNIPELRIQQAAYPKLAVARGLIELSARGRADGAPTKSRLRGLLDSITR
jgi:hypothetical protein